MQQLWTSALCTNDATDIKTIAGIGEATSHRRRSLFVH
jgi:hypothetical protein